jgi:hypothetical protein
MNRSESITALVKQVNSKIKRVPAPVSKSKPEPRLISEPKTLLASEFKPNHFLEQIFLRNGYLRIRIRKKQENKKNLKSTKEKPSVKEYEIRLIPIDREELGLIRAAITELGLYVSNTFIKHNHIVQPIYGKEITLKFQKLRDNYRANNQDIPLNRAGHE